MVKVMVLGLAAQTVKVLALAKRLAFSLEKLVE
jgi:hypothetical protein